MIRHLAERIEYAKDELAWLERGAPEGEEPWRGWEHGAAGEVNWYACVSGISWNLHGKYRRRPKMLHAIDAKGVRWEWPEPMREAPRLKTQYWFFNLMDNMVYQCQWDDLSLDSKRLAANICQSTEEGAQAQLAALRAVCRGGE